MLELHDLNSSSNFLSNNANNANDLIRVEKRTSRSVCLLFSLVQLALHFSRKMVVDKNLTFVKQMKKATQEIHDLSDAMINAKLGIGMYIFKNYTQ